MLKLLAGLMFWSALTTGVCSAAITSCTISTSAVGFGAYDVFAISSQTAAGTVSYKCSGTSPSPISIGFDQGGQTSYMPRAMSSGSNHLAYNLYLDAGRSTIWGDGTGGSGIFSTASPALGTTVGLTVFGWIPAGQNVRAGAYGDTITTTVNF